MGVIEAEQPLGDAIVQASVWAAQDPRFPRLQLEELGGLEVEVSVLSPAFPVAGPQAIEIGKHPETGEAVVAKVGRYGPYLQVGLGENGERVIASIPTDIPPADLTVEQALEILQKKQDGPRLVGSDPETGLPVYAMHGRYGAYVQLGENPEGKKVPKPKRASMPWRPDSLATPRRLNG